MSDREKTINWYMRLNDHFFTDREIVEIENLPPERFGRFFGSFVLHLYMKMMCYSISSNGVLIFDQVFEMSSDITLSVARRLHFTESLTEVKQALMILEKYGLIEISTIDENCRLFIPKVVDNTGRTTLGSEGKRRRRLAARKGEQLLLSGEPERIKPGKYGDLKNITLFEDEYERLKAKTKDIERVIFQYGYSKVGRESDNEKSDYDSIIKFIEGMENEVP